MDDHYYKQLVKRYLEGKSTDVELEVFTHLLREGKLDSFLKDALDTETEAITEDIIVFSPKRRFLWLKYTAVASIFLVSISVVYFYFVNSRSNEEEQRLVQSTSKEHKNDILPGGDKAILTLANGTRVILDKADDGQIAKQGNINIEKIKDGHLTYQRLNNEHLKIDRRDPVELIAYNTVSTPRAGQYQIILADGTKVWLNSFSSITFPTSFVGKERKVKITGEVYIEVVKDDTLPFIVEAKGQQIEVLGTSFNINAYEDERTVNTTLVSGRIKVITGVNSKILNPGQQAEVIDNQIKVRPVIDISAVVAWKNGYFDFNNADLPTLMRQLSRWYDINPIYVGDVGSHEFVGNIKRANNLSNVLKILKLSGVQFRIEGQNLLINPDNKQKYSPK